MLFELCVLVRLNFPSLLNLFFREGLEEAVEYLKDSADPQKKSCWTD